MELLALSSDNSYPQEGSPPVSAVLSPSNNSVFNYQLPPTQPRVYHQMAYGMAPKPKLVQQQPMVAQQQQVAQQLSPPHTLHPGQAMSLQQGQSTRGYPQMTPQPQHMYNQSVSPPSSVSAAPGPFQNELLAALTHVINGQHQQQQQATQQQLHFIKQQEKARQQKLQLHKNEMLRRRLSRWETLTQQNRGYLLSLNNVEDQFRAICALSLLAVPEPQY